MAYLFAWILFPIFSAVLASNKNRSSFGWFLIGLLFGPFGLLVGLMSPLEKQREIHSDNILYDIEVDDFNDDWNEARMKLLKFYDENVSETYKIMCDTKDEIYAIGPRGKYFKMNPVVKEDGKHIIIEAVRGIVFHSASGTSRADIQENSLSEISDFVKLAELYKQGLLTDEEFEAQKKKYLA